MGEKSQRAKENVDEKIEQQIRLENARKDRIEAETKQAKQQSRDKARQQQKGHAIKMALKSKYGIGLGCVVLIIIIVVVGLILPLLFDKHETQYVTESSLKEAVQIDKLTSAEYVYRGIAEIPGHFLWMDSVECRVKYEAHVRASYEMNDIQFTIDNEKKNVTVYLPDAKIDNITLDETKFGYLPEKANINMRDVLKICREDATREINTDQIKEQADESLQSIVEGLTMPLLDNRWKIEFESLSAYEGGEFDEAN